MHTQELTKKDILEAYGAVSNSTGVKTPSNESSVNGMSKEEEEWRKAHPGLITGGKSNRSDTKKRRGATKKRRGATKKRPIKKANKSKRRGATKKRRGPGKK